MKREREGNNTSNHSNDCLWIIMIIYDHMIIINIILIYNIGSEPESHFRAPDWLQIARWVPFDSWFGLIWLILNFTRLQGLWPYGSWRELGPGGHPSVPRFMLTKWLAILLVGWVLRHGYFASQLGTPEFTKDGIPALGSPGIPWAQPSTARIPGWISWMPWSSAPIWSFLMFETCCARWGEEH